MAILDETITIKRDMFHHRLKVSQRNFVLICSVTSVLGDGKKCQQNAFLVITAISLFVFFPFSSSLVCINLIESSNVYGKNVL